MSPSLAELILEKFIARHDVKAIQRERGAYNPVQSKFTVTDLQDHLDKKVTYGHYILDKNDKCKLLAFDIDFNETGKLPVDPEDAESELADCNPRDIWRDRAHPARPLMKAELRSLSGLLAARIFNLMEIPTAVAYSGCKGVHVYGFTGLCPAEDAIMAATEIVLKDIGDFTAQRGDNFFSHPEYPNVSIEVFPKQSSIGKEGYGNLLRLPLGRNLKSPDPTFFVDMRAAMNQLTPMDSLKALTTSDPWAD